MRGRQIAFLAAFLLALCAATPHAALGSFPGRPGSIAFNLTFHSRGVLTHGGLYAIRPGWENPRRLTANPRDYNPSFAPSGRRLVFRRTAPESSEGLYTLDLRSGKTRRLTARGSDQDPALGRRGMIVFSRSSDRSRSYDLVLRSPDGRLRWLTSSTGSDKTPVFTPNGRRVLFVRNYRKFSPRLLGEAVLLGSGDFRSSQRLFSIRIDGTGLRPVKAVWEATNFDVSPDGRRLAFDRWTDRQRIWMVPLRGGKPRLFSNDATYPAYSPGGCRIAYTNHEGLWLRRIGTGAQPRLLFRAEYQPAGPAAPPEPKSALAVTPAWQPIPLATAQWWHSTGSRGADASSQPKRERVIGQCVTRHC